METPPNPNDEFTPEDELKAENELLKLRIELEHGGLMGGGDSNLPPDIENEFLKHIMQFEEQYKDAKRITVYDFIGRPEYKPASELSGVFLEMELDRLQDIMEDKGMSLDFICEYETIVKYEFLTEELFQEETDDMHIEGLVTHFTYEEFHPNHEHDLKEYAADFLRHVLEREWDEQFTTHELAEVASIGGKQLDRAAIGVLIKNFKDSFAGFEIMEWKINSVAFDMETRIAQLNAHLSYKAFTEGTRFIEFEGQVQLGYEMKWELWRINSVEFPGLKQ